MENTQRRSVLLTGAAGGIGSATVRLLTQRGYRVFAGVRQADPAEAAGVHPVRVDVTDPDSVAAAAEEVARLAPDGLHAVVNNAGIIVQGPLELVPPADLARQFAVNTLGPATVTQAFLPLLRAGHGRVVNVSAPTAHVAPPFFGPIAASKAALESLSDALRLELAAWHIPVIIVEPGGTATEIFAKAAAAQQVAQSAAEPGRVALYTRQLDAVARVADRQRLGGVEPVARAILEAVDARRPRRRYPVGDARAFGVVAKLPAGLRDRVVAGVFGQRGL